LYLRSSAAERISGTSTPLDDELEGGGAVFAAISVENIV
jgi:hypothetical protein